MLRFFDTVSLHFIIQYRRLLKQSFSVFQNCTILTVSASRSASLSKAYYLRVKFSLQSFLQHKFSMRQTVFYNFKSITTLDHDYVTSHQLWARITNTHQWDRIILQPWEDRRFSDGPGHLHDGNITAGAPGLAVCFQARTGIPKRLPFPSGNGQLEN